MKSLNWLAGVVGGLVGFLAVFGWVGGNARASAHSSTTCAKCHIPHQAGLPTDAVASWGVPLWNTGTYNGKAIRPAGSNGETTFTLYSSDTLPVQVSSTLTQPDGPSKLCLGCHDGTYFGGTTSPFAFAAADGLTRSHPLSFVYDSALAKAVPNDVYDPTLQPSGLGGTIQQDLLDSHGKMQCTSCHDVHTQGIGTYLLRFQWTATAGDGLDNTFCRTCHTK